MESPFIVANLKSFLTLESSKHWLESFKNSFKNSKKSTIIICPPFTLLETFKNFFEKENISVKLGAQDISPFGEGAYTGEINGLQVKDFADYVLIGHSERRSNFSEKDEMLSKKVEQSLKNNLTPLYFVQTPDQDIISGVEYVVYEPPGSISNASGNVPDSIEDVAMALEAIKSKGEYKVFYGGSVNSANVQEFLRQTDISGVLVGGASLEPEEFIQIIQNA